MAGQQRNMEGDENQKRKAAREAKREGKSASEVGATTGASKQIDTTAHEKGQPHGNRSRQEHD